MIYIFIYIPVYVDLFIIKNYLHFTVYKSYSFPNICKYVYMFSNIYKMYLILLFHGHW